MVYLKQTDNKPAAIVDLMARDLQLALDEGWINRFQQIELDRTLTRLCDAMGKCERIKNTVFPSTYSLYIHLAMMLFIILLPFSIIQFVGMFEVPLVIAISACFLLIEKMAIHLQDPFENKPTDTPMTAIAQTIENNLSQLYLLATNKEEKQPLSIFENYIENGIVFDRLDTSNGNKRNKNKQQQKVVTDDHYYVL